MTLAAWSSLALVCLLGAMSPGPSLVLVARQSVVNSRRHGLVTAWAHAVGIGAYAFATVIGLSTLLARYPSVYMALAISGALYLIWLGVATWRRAGAGATAGWHEGGRSAVGAAALQGVLTALLNPKVGVFFLALFSQFLTPGMGVGVGVLLSATALFIDGLWYTLVAVLLSRPVWVARVKSAGWWIDRAAAVALILLGLLALI